MRISSEVPHSLYANAFKISGAAGQIAIMLGLNPGLMPGQLEAELRFAQCLFLSPSTARGLAAALTRVLQEYDSLQPPRTPPAVPPDGAGDILSVGQPAAGPSLRVAAGQADLLFNLLDSLQAPYGLERSFRICTGTLQGSRFLLSLHTKSLGDQARPRILDICRRMIMPADFQQAIEEHLGEADIIHLGFEGHGNRCLYKVYLERGAALRQEVAPAEPSGPRLLHLAFKWDPDNALCRFVTRYVWYPALAIRQIDSRLSEIFHGQEHRESLEITRGLLEIAGRRIGAEKVLYLEAAEEGTPRKSFDINLYAAGLQLQDMYGPLSKMCRHFSIPYEEFHALYEPVKARSFGHISGGIHREREEFFSVYYGVEGRGG